MTTAEVKRIIDIIVDDARVPTVSFTGGEPTLRPDLPDLIAYAKSRRLRTNLITNGRRCGATGYAERLAAAREAFALNEVHRQEAWAVTELYGWHFADLMEKGEFDAARFVALRADDV